MNRIIALIIVALSLGQCAVGDYARQTGLGGNLYLVNRQFPLAQDYEPEDLVKPDVLCAYQTTRIRKAAAVALQEMFDAAKKDGYRLMVVSGYRSYATQKTILSKKITSLKSKDKAMLMVASPGTSEHQLGLAIDIGRKAKQGLNEAFGSTAEGKWLRENCARFGFIIRYKKEWTDITGYMYEPWHIRYVGKEHAQAITKLDIPLEHYVAVLRGRILGDYLLGNDAKSIVR